MQAITLLSSRFGKLIQYFSFLIRGEIYLGYKSNIKLKKYPMPTLFDRDNDNVIIKTSLCCICGTDLMKLSENNSFLKRFSSIKRSGDIFLGHEVVGVITETKNLKQKHLNIGDRVILIEQNNCKTMNLNKECHFCYSGMPLLCSNKHKRKYSDNVYGGWSDHFVRNEFQVFKIPNNISDKSASLIEPASIAFKVAKSIKLFHNNSILIIGCGVISLISIRILRLLHGDKITIHVIARHEFQSDEAYDAGANLVHRVFSLQNISKDLKTNIIGGLGNAYLNVGYDTVIDYVGSEETNNQALSVVKSKGNILLVGFNNNMIKVGFDHLIQREISMVGIHGYDSSSEKNTKLAAFQELIKYLENDLLSIDRYVSHTFSISDYKLGIKKAISHFKIKNNLINNKCLRVGFKF